MELDVMPHLTSRLNEAYDERAEALLSAHRGVRHAIGATIAAGTGIAPGCSQSPMNSG